MPSKVEVLRFYRPEDISQEQAYRSGFWDVFASSEKLCISIDSIVGHCKVAVAVDALEGEFQTSDLLPNRFPSQHVLWNSVKSRCSVDFEPTQLKGKMN